MARFTRAELEEALAIYNAARDAASTTGDWRPWSDLFTDDAHYIEPVSYTHLTLPTSDLV